MSKYSIKDLERLTNIKAHTIRIWEKRYGIITPQRTDTNIRYYTDEQVKKLINISILNKSGYKVSEIADLDSEEIKQKVLDVSQRTSDHFTHIQLLLSSMLKLDESAFKEEFAIVNNKLGFLESMTKVIYPLLNNIGVLWLTDQITPAHEHFISNLVRQQIIHQTENLPVIEEGKSTWILFLPQNETHELALLLANYILKKHQIKTFYLGQNIPSGSLDSTLAEIECDNVFSIWTSNSTNESFDKYYEVAKRNNCGFIYSSSNDTQSDVKKGHKINSPDDLIKFITKI